GLDADADVRHAVHGHQAVRAGAGAAEQAARTVVLEAPREHPAAGGEQRGADRVPGERLDEVVLEAEGDRLRAVDALAGLRREPHRAGGRAGGSSTFTTSFVRVSRSARNQAPQPCRWYHHSRCTPATLRRK